MTKIDIIEKVKKHMDSINLGYDANSNFQSSDKNVEKLRDGKNKAVYTVSFRTSDTINKDQSGKIVSLIEGTYCFCYVDAKSFEILYYSTSTGYIEVSTEI